LLTGDGYPWALLWVAWAQRQEVPFIVTVHDPERHPGHNVWETLNARLRRFVLGKAAGVHVHSPRFTELIAARDAGRIIFLSFGTAAWHSVS
jgi:hypothetical protein